MTEMKILFYDWLGRYKDYLPDKVRAYCLLSIKQYVNKFARFCMAAKMYKDSLTIPPFCLIVCCIGTFMNCWSKWFDFQLSKLILCHVKTYIKDYQQILDDTRVLQLPSNAGQFAANANLMQNNIDIEHAIKDILQWLSELDTKGLLTKDIPLKALKMAMELIMKHNVRALFSTTHWHSHGHICSSDVGHFTLSTTKIIISFSPMAIVYHTSVASLMEFTVLGLVTIPTNRENSAMISLTLES